MEERAEITTVDTGDLNAMARWARGMYRGQTVAHLASIWGIEPTMEAVLAEVGKGFPDPARKIVVKVAEKELRKAKNR
jgi:hypothetical protein